jgi:hypothetical protein
VSALFKGSPDLIDEFKQFLPDPTGANPASNGMFGLLAGAGEIGRGEMDRERLDKKKASAVAADKGAPPKRKKRVHEEKTLPLKPVQQPKVGTALVAVLRPPSPCRYFRQSAQSTTMVANLSPSRRRTMRPLPCPPTRKMVVINLTTA